MKNGLDVLQDKNNFAIRNKMEMIEKFIKTKFDFIDEFNSKSETKLVLRIMEEIPHEDNYNPKLPAQQCREPGYKGNLN